jgi:hypothetical protein
MHETFNAPILYTLADLINVGLAGVAIGVFICAVFFIVARGAE